MKFESLLLAGFSLGAVYGLVALGFVILFKASGVMNFAQGSFIVLGAYVTARTYDVLGFGGAAIAGILTAALCSVLIERVLVRPIRDSPHMTLTIMTIGVQVVLDTWLASQIGAEILPVGQPWGASPLMFGGVSVPWNRAIAFMVAVVIIAVFLLAFRFSAWGVSMRAAAEDRETAELVGLRLGRISVVAWLVAGALAAVAGIFLTGSPTPGLAPTLGAIAIRAFTAAVIGGMESVTGALVGGMLIGMIETFFAGYQNDLTFLGRGFGEVAPFIVMLVILLVRPQGLFGRKESVRV